MSSRYEAASEVKRMTNRASRVTVVKLQPQNQPADGREKSVYETTDDEEDKDLEVDEKIPYSSNIKDKKNSNKKKEKKGSKKVTKNPATMVKKVPNFFGIDSTDNESEHEIESAYTELARKLFLQKLEGKGGDVYGMMTNDFKLRSVIEK